MAIFYEVSTKDGVVGCETKLKDAHALGKSIGGQYSVIRLDVDVSTENVRRLIGDLGGYSNSTTEIPVSVKEEEDDDDEF